MKRSRILREVHETATAMHRSGTIDKQTMRTFDSLALPQVPDVSEKQKTRRRRKRTQVEPSSGNVFEDLGLPNAPALHTEAQLVAAASGRSQGNLLQDDAKQIKRFRHTAGFGRRIEYWIIGRMLKEGLDVYVPLVDDNAIDAVVRRNDGSFVEVQIKARSNDVKEGDCGLYSAIPHELRNNYWFIFYSERLDTTWIMTSQEFIDHAVQNKTGKNVGLRGIWFNGRKGGKEYVKPQFARFVAHDFKRIATAV